MSSLPSTKFNEMVFQLLFSLDMGDCLEGDLIPFVMRELSLTRKTVREGYQKARAIFEDKEPLDQVISKISIGYDFERIGRVERNILRMAFYEIERHKEEERPLIIAEALRLTRKFSTKEATAFVNAILDQESKDGIAVSPSEREVAE